MPSNPAHAMPNSVVDEYWASSQPAGCAAGHAVEYLGHLGCNSCPEGLAAAYNGVPG